MSDELMQDQVAYCREMADARRASWRAHRQMEAALIQIRDEAATKDNGGAWAAGIAILCLATLPQRCAECNCENGGANCHWIGKYRADYSPVTPEEIAAPDSELDELYRNSIPVQRT